jgi:hypothetical protein
MSRMTTLALAVITVLALGACTAQEPEFSLNDQVPADQRQAEPADDGADAPAADAGAVTYEAFDLGLDGPGEIPAGDVTIRLSNTGNLPHDITVEELGNRKVVQADGGGTDEATVSLEAGTYTFYCSVPGHRAAMEMTVDVTG